MFGKNVAAGKLCAFFYEIEDRAFSLAADGGQVSQVDDEFASASLQACISPACAQLSNPGPDESSFHD